MRNERRKLPSYVEVLKREWVVVAENRRSARFHNPDGKDLYKVLVDGGMITEGERADYILAHRKVVDIVVELKGSDVSKAISQIRATLPVWRKSEWAGKTHGALVVRGKGLHPRETARNEQRKRVFRGTLHMKLVIETSNRDYEFSEFLLGE